MESSEGIRRFFDNRTILVTGAAGFLAKVLVEKILRIQPNVRKMYLLLRASDNDAAKKRLEIEVVGIELFKVAREKFGEDFDSIISEKLVVVPGDITRDNLGIDDPDLITEMWKDIDIIVNSAATTDFYERYDVSLDINTMGVVNVLEFAKKCSKLKVLLHVSTAYVCGEGKGLIPEKEYHMGEALNSTQTRLDFVVEKRVVAEKLNKLRELGVPEAEIATLMRDFGIQRAKEFGWPNTYVFTKAMGEMCLGEYKDNLPTVIIRPTMITSTYKEPFSGWIEGLRTLDSVVVNYGKGKISCFLAHSNLIMDMIPADMVINAMVIAMVVHANDESSKPFIYHVGSSLRNPMTFSNVHLFSYRYFADNPLLDKHGKPVTIAKCYVLSDMTAFRAYVAIRFRLPLKILQVLNTIIPGCVQDVYNKSNRKFKLVMRLVDLYQPYLMFKGVFDDINSERLRQKAKEMYKMEADLFNFDPICIDWKEYIMSSHLPGLKKYVIK